MNENATAERIAHLRRQRAKLSHDPGTAWFDREGILGCLSDIDKQIECLMGGDFYTRDHFRPLSEAEEELATLLDARADHMRDLANLERREAERMRKRAALQRQLEALGACRKHSEEG